MHPDLEGTDHGRLPSDADTDIQPAARPTHDGDKTNPIRPGPSPTPRPPMPSQPLSPVDGYEILGVLGRGGMGIVYKARHVKLDRIVALKMVLSGGHTGPREKERFLAEARAVARMKHPNILPVYDYGVSISQHPWFSLEFVEGGTLQEKLDQFAMAPREAAELVEVVALGLHYAHEQGILHRDIKPANVLLTKEGTPKISDFGLAKKLDVEESINPSEMVVGTPMYMSPEQANGRADIGRAADVYSLGATLYEMLVGRPPFRGTTVLDTLQMVQHEEPLAPRQLQPSVPEDLQTICLKCLHKDPRQRYDSAAAFAHDLRNFLDDKPISARPVSAFEKVWKWARRKPAFASLIAVSVVSLLGFAIGGTTFAVTESRRADEQTKLRVRADELRKLADDRGREAIRNFQKAQEAVGVLVRLARNRMTNERHIETVGRELMEKALVFYDDFLATDQDDPLMREQVARAHFQAGDLREKLGRYQDADDAFTRAEAIYGELITEFPKRAGDLKRDLAAIQISRSTVLQALRKEDEAEAAFLRGEKLLHESAQSEAPDAVSDSLLAAALNNRGNQLARRGELTLAKEAFTHSINRYSTLVEQFPKDGIFRFERARVRTNLASRLPAEEASRAAPLFKEAIAELGMLVKSHPDIPLCRMELARAHLNRGKIALVDGDYTEAGADLEKAAVAFDALASEYVGVADYRQLSGIVHVDLGTLHRRKEEYARAVEEYRKAEKRFARLAADEPTVGDYRHNQAIAMTDLARVLEIQINHASKAIRANPEDPVMTALTDDTEKVWHQSLAQWYKLNDDFRGDISYAAGLAKTHGKVCNFHKYMAGIFRKVKPTAAETHLLKRVALRRDILARMPKDDILRDQLADGLLALAFMRVEMKKHAESAAAIDEMMKIPPTDWELLPLGAGCLAQCLAQADKSLTAPEREQTIKAYGDRALDMLESAVKSGWEDSNGFLGKHPILQPLRARPEYRQRLESLQKSIDQKQAGETKTSTL